MANEIIVEHIKKKEWEAAIPQITADACTDQQREKIFNDLNGLERMAVYREILKSMDTSKYNVKYFLLLKPSEQGLVLDELDVNDIAAMFNNFNEAQRIALFEVLPYNIVEKMVPLMTDDEKRAIGLLEDSGADGANDRKKGKCTIS